MPRSGTIAARLPRRSCVPRPASQPSTRPRLYGSRSIEAVRHVNESGGVADRPADATEDRGQRPHAHLGALRDPAVRALEPEHAGEPGRDAQRAATVAAGPDRDEAAGHGGRPPTGRPARRAGEIPWVARGAVEIRPREVHSAELARRREADEHGAGEPQPADERRIMCGHAVLQRHARLRVRPARDGVELLHAYGNAAERCFDVHARGNGSAPLQGPGTRTH